jgi:hypothetical protein
MDYNSSESIKDAGRQAFNEGLKLSDCPISSRTHSNAVHYWNFGWHDASNNNCKGPKCKAVKGVGHSLECENMHNSQYLNI